MNWYLIGILIYILFQVGVALFVFRRIFSEKDYFLAGRSLGFIIVTFSAFATWFGAETCIGSAGAIFEKGLSGGRADPFGYTFCLLFMGLFFASKLWKKNLTTLGDLFKERYSRRVETLAVLIMIPASIMWAAAQIRAFGQIISSVSEFHITSAITFAAGIVILYTSLGGLLADAITDLVQSVVLILGLVILFVVVMYSPDSPAGILSTIEYSRLNPFALEESSWFLTIEGWMVPILGSLIAQELISRVLAARSPKVAQISCLYASGIYLIVGLIPVFLGLIGPSLFTDLSDPEQLLPMMAKKYLNPFLYVLFTGALVSAILSTVDSTLLAVSSLFSHNLIVPILKNPSEKKKILWARAIVILSGIGAYVLAMNSEGIYALVESASAFGGAGIFTITLFGLFTKFGDEWSALLALVTGIAALLISEHVFELNTPFLISLAVSLGAYCLVPLLKFVKGYLTNIFTDEPTTA